MFIKDIDKNIATMFILTRAQFKFIILNKNAALYKVELLKTPSQNKYFLGHLSIHLAKKDFLISNLG